MEACGHDGCRAMPSFSRRYSNVVRRRPRRAAAHVAARSPLGVLQDPEDVLAFDRFEGPAPAGDPGPAGSAAARPMPDAGPDLGTG